MIFHQLFELESSTFTYVLGDSTSSEAIIIDPVLETVERDLKLLNEWGLSLKYILETHVHADHITGAWHLREATGAEIGVGVKAPVDTADRFLADGESLVFGKYQLQAMSTPGHTDGCTSYVCEGKVFTGDALLIRGCGRTDFQQGSPETLFHSVREKLFSLPDETVVYPGHEYQGRDYSSIGEEKKWNSRLRLDNDLETFTKIMNELNLAEPKKIKEAVPANLQSGRVQ